MKCDEVRKRLSRFLDGELNVREKELVSRHIEQCPGCRQELAALEADRAILRTAQMPETPAYLVTRVMAEVRSQTSGRQRTSPFWARAFATAAAVLVVVAGAWFGTVLGREIAGNGNGSTESVLSVDVEPSLDDIYQAVAEEVR